MAFRADSLGKGKRRDPQPPRARRFDLVCDNLDIKYAEEQPLQARRRRRKHPKPHVPFPFSPTREVLEEHRKQCEVEGKYVGKHYPK